MGNELLSAIGPVLAVFKIYLDSREKIISVDEVEKRHLEAVNGNEVHFEFELKNRSVGLRPLDFDGDFVFHANGQFSGRPMAKLYARGQAEAALGECLSVDAAGDRLILKKSAFTRMCNRGDSIVLRFSVVNDGHQKIRVHHCFPYVYGCAFQYRVGPFPSMSTEWLMSWVGIFCFQVLIGVVAARMGAQDVGAFWISIGFILFAMALYYGIALGVLYGLARWAARKAKWAILGWFVDQKVKQPIR